MNVKRDLTIGSRTDRTLSRSALVKARNAYYLVACKYYETMNRTFNDGDNRWDNIQYVSPEQIQYITHNDNHLDYGHGYLNAGAFDIAKRSGGRVGGKWDQKEIEFEELHIYPALENRFLHGVGWEETRFFDEMVASIEEDERPWRCTSVDDLWDRCEYIETLFEQIQRNGYQSQRELGKVPVDEVTVNVGRDGTLFFNDGRHRLAIAKVLDIEQIPVRILVTHEEYSGEPTVREQQQANVASPTQ